MFHIPVIARRVLFISLIEEPILSAVLTESLEFSRISLKCRNTVLETRSYRIYAVSILQYKVAVYLIFSE